MIELTMDELEVGLTSRLPRPSLFGPCVQGLGGSGGLILGAPWWGRASRFWASPPPAILPSSPNIDMPQLPSTRFLPPTKTTPDGATRGNRLQM